jgi:hypothetical protein
LLLLPWVVISAGAAHAAEEEATKKVEEVQRQTVAPDKPVARVQGTDQNTLDGKLNSLLQKAKEKLFFRAPPLPPSEDVVHAQRCTF